MRGRPSTLAVAAEFALAVGMAAPRAARAQATDNSVAAVGASFDWIPIGSGLSGLGYDVDLVLRVPGTNRTEPFFTLGAGVRTMVAEKTGLRFEARDRIYHVPGDLINDFHFSDGVEFFF